MNKPVRFPWLSVIIFIAILYLTLSPSPLPPPLIPTFNGWDKLAHFAMFGVWSAAVVYDVARRVKCLTIWGATMIVFLVAVISGLIELAQGTEIVNRACDITDFIANSLGAILLGYLSYYICRCRLDYSCSSR